MKTIFKILSIFFLYTGVLTTVSVFAQKPDQIIGMALDGDNNHIFTWLNNGKVIAGSTDNLNKYRLPYKYSLPPGVSINNIVAMALDGDNNHVFTWFRRGNRLYVCAGSTSDLDKYRNPYLVSLPPGKQISDIVGMAIDGDNNHVYTWFRDRTVCAGSTNDLDKYRPLYVYSLPPGKSPSNIVGMAIDGDNNHIYTWFNDYKVSGGTTNDLDRFRKLYKYYF